MGTIISVASGKGGVGKTTCCCHLGRALAQRGKKTLLVELDSGLRGMDLFLGVSDVVYALNDLLTDGCTLDQASLPIPGADGLYLIAAPSTFHSIPIPEQLITLAQTLKQEYDYVIFDSPAGSALIDVMAQFSDLLILLVLPEPVCLRDAANVATYLYNDTKRHAEIRLLINRVSHKNLHRNHIKYLDNVIDQTGVPLIGVLPDCTKLFQPNATGLPLKKRCLPAAVFQAIAARLDGEDVPLVLK